MARQVLPQHIQKLTPRHLPSRLPSGHNGLWYEQRPRFDSLTEPRVCPFAG